MIGLSAGSTSYTQKLLIGVVMLVSLLLTACGGGIAGDDKNYIVVKDQSVIYLDEIVISQVTADQNLLIVIYSENNVKLNSKSNTVIGYTAVSAGDYQDVVVKLNKTIANNETLFAELRTDNGTIGMFEPEVDTLVVQSVEAVSFGVLKSADPYLEIWLDDLGQRIVTSREKTANSKPLADGAGLYLIAAPARIDLKKVIASEESWLVAYRTNADSTIDVIGVQKIDEGHHSDVTMALSDVLITGDQVLVGLYEVSDNSNGTFDPVLNIAIRFNEEPVTVSFVAN